MNWHDYFISLAEQVALKSKDSTKVGAVIVGPTHHEIRSVGFNGFPRGVDETIASRWERPTKYLYVEHAERNAILNAARIGIPVHGCHLYLNWEPTPCTDCAKAVIQAGITTLIGPRRPFPKNRDWSFEVSQTMLTEAGISLLLWP